MLIAFGKKVERREEVIKNWLDICIILLKIRETKGSINQRSIKEILITKINPQTQIRIINNSRDTKTIINENSLTRFSLRY